MGFVRELTKGEQREELSVCKQISDRVQSVNWGSDCSRIVCGQRGVRDSDTCLANQCFEATSDFRWLGHELGRFLRAQVLLAAALMSDRGNSQQCNPNLALMPEAPDFLHADRCAAKPAGCVAPLASLLRVEHEAVLLRR